MKKPLLILAILMQWSPSEAHCFSIWHFHHPQRCRIIAHVAPVLPRTTEKVAKYEPEPEQIEIPLPTLDITDWTWDIVKAKPDIVERLEGLAKLRALQEGR